MIVGVRVLTIDNRSKGTDDRKSGLDCEVVNPIDPSSPPIHPSRGSRGVPQMAWQHNARASTRFTAVRWHVTRGFYDGVVYCEQEVATVLVLSRPAVREYW